MSDLAPPGLASIALQTCRMEAMRDFYGAAFGFRFAAVDAGGMACWFGTLPGLTLKLVPLRDTVDFASYPLHQLGFTVPDPEAVAELAVRYGGRREDEGSIRDPDGNTIEVYGV